MVTPVRRASQGNDARHGLEEIVRVDGVEKTTKVASPVEDVKENGQPEGCPLGDD
jgi:hypothetical protein